MAHFQFLFYCTLLLSYLTNAIQIEPYTTDLNIWTNGITSEDGTDYVVYTSIVEYSQVTTEFTDEQLAGLCKQAYDEMKSVHEEWAQSCSSLQQDYLESVRPGMMSAIAIGNLIYFASSSKKNSPNVFLQHSELRFTQDMIRCWASTAPPYSPTPGQGTGLHRTDANCGEIQAAALYLAFNGKTIQESSLTAKMVAFGTDAESVQKPCGDENDWQAGKFSCENWADYAKISWVGKDTAPEQVDIAPKDHHEVDLRDIWTIMRANDVDKIQGFNG